MNNYLAAWEQHTNFLVQKFVDDNFPDSEWDWVADEIGDVFEVNDFYFSLDDVVQFIKNECTTDQIIAYKDYATDIATNNLGPKIPEPTLNIKNWKKIMGK